MATLSEAADGHYYIKTVAYAGAGRAFITYQVSDAGVAWLSSQGVDVGEEVSPHQIQTMREHGFLTTGGSGVEILTLDIATPAVTEQRGSLSGEARLRLDLEEDEADWGLSVVLPEVPREWADARVLAKCHLLVDGSLTIPAIRLWPGKGETMCSVEPHQQPYTVRPEGQWPPEWEVARWLGSAAGLNPSGTLFDSDQAGGLQLRAGRRIEPGAHYWLVAMKGRLHAKPPSALDPRPLNPRSGWEAWQISVPASVEESVREWCERLGAPAA